MKKKKKAATNRRTKTRLQAKAKKTARRRSPAKAKAKAKGTRMQRPKARKSARKKPRAKVKLSVIPPPNSVLLGRVEDYYAQIQVIALTLEQPVQTGDRVNVLGHTTNIEQTVDSIQIDHQSVNEARAKDAVGIKVNTRARHGDYVFKLIRQPALADAPTA